MRKSGESCTRLVFARESNARSRSPLATPLRRDEARRTLLSQTNAPKNLEQVTYTNLLRFDFLLSFQSQQEICGGRHSSSSANGTGSAVVNGRASSANELFVRGASSATSFDRRRREGRQRRPARRVVARMCCATCDAYVSLISSCFAGIEGKDC